MNKKQSIQELAAIYGIAMLPETALQHQIIDINGNLQPFTIDNLAEAIDQEERFRTHLKNAIQEVADVKAGKKKAQTLDDFLNDL